MVYIPGAAGDSRESAPPQLGLHGADLLVERGLIIIAVTGYRRQALGWLCPTDVTSTHSPGNQALKDVLQVLRWVQRHIHAFGGDSNRVTAWGDGEGAALVHMLQAHLQEKPFQAVVLTGGSALAPWAFAGGDPGKSFHRLTFKHLALALPNDQRKKVKFM